MREQAAMDQPRLVVVGNGMAGCRTLEELLAIAPDLYRITVFGAEPHGNYNRIQLSPVLAGETTLDAIMLNDLGWYARHGIERGRLGARRRRRRHGHRTRQPQQLDPGPERPPGSDTSTYLLAHGFSAAEVDALLATGAITQA